MDEYDIFLAFLFALALATSALFVGAEISYRVDHPRPAAAPEGSAWMWLARSRMLALYDAVEKKVLAPGLVT